MCLKLALDRSKTGFQVTTFYCVVNLHLVASQLFLLLCYALSKHIISTSIN